MKYAKNYDRSIAINQAVCFDLQKISVWYNTVYEFSGVVINEKIAVGILAHVDSGKTTLSEALMYSSGSITRLGRVDHRDSFLDTFSLERDRGITIFQNRRL